MKRRRLAGQWQGWLYVAPALLFVGVFFASSPVLDYDGARASAATGYYPPIFHGLLEGGVAWAPGAYEILFPSLAHSEADIERTVEAAGEAAGH